VTARRPGEREERSRLDEADASTTLKNTFGLTLSEAGPTGALEALERKGTRGVTHPFFA
jgi:hypothetical protein